MTPLDRRQASNDRIASLKPGVYRHYKGPLYEVEGVAHDANEEDRIVVLYIGLQLDSAHEGPRRAVRSIEDFQAVLCKTHGYCNMRDCSPPGCQFVERFKWLGYAFHAGMLQEAP